MKTYVLDASAVIRYLSHGIGEEKVHALIQRAARSEAHLLISVVNWGEALYSLAKMAGLGKATATVRFHYRLGYADCYAASLAIRMEATLVTTDPDFAKLGKKLKILSLSGDVP
jgi:predicted nucleic acid-binding protein